ncbi:hypothetical protein N665_0922s0009 [Sinapis alba]|nr:hypothetical protein N665_0922s0009 [Sinapis alba]
MAQYLVTGGTSFIASHVVKALLDLGHFVRTTVRDSSADLTVEGSFDEAVKGVDGVFHIASRVSVHLDDNDLEKLVDRDIYGTRNLMNSCEKSRNTVKRIVLTSSSTSVQYRYDATTASPLNESHYSDLEYCRNFKTLCEKEAWLIAAEKNLNLVVVIPSFCIGPILNPKPTSSPLILLSIVRGACGEYPNFSGGFVHIEDVAAAQILAMEKPKASGRFMCGSEKGRDMPHSLDTRKIRELGLALFKPLVEMFDDCIKCFQDKGLL